jgi:membrane associated rhomboid family serine protease
VDPQLLIFLYIMLSLIGLLPIKDRRARERAFPWMTATLVVINVLVHLGVTYAVYWDAPPAQDVPNWLPLYPYMQVSGLIMNAEGLGALSVLTSTFLHADFSHLLWNMFYLWFFGRKVEDSTGSLRFLIFYLLCGFMAGFVTALASTTLLPEHARIPGLGASGAIAGVMGAYLFLYSEQRIFTLPTLQFFTLSEFCFMPVPIPIPLWLPAWVFLVYRFLQDAILAQLVVEMAEQGFPLNLGVGVFAHLGGALGGLVLIYFFIHPEVMAQRR